MKSIKLRNPFKLNHYFELHSFNIKNFHYKFFDCLTEYRWEFKHHNCDYIIFNFYHSFYIFFLFQWVPCDSINLSLVLIFMDLMADYSMFQINFNYFIF